MQFKDAIELVSQFLDENWAAFERFCDERTENASEIQASIKEDI